MMRRRMVALVAACGHHWHVTAKGWACCACPGRVKAAQAAPDPGTAVCVAAPVADTMEAWLAPARPGHRPGRRQFRRSRA